MTDVSFVFVPSDLDFPIFPSTTTFGAIVLKSVWYSCGTISGWAVRNKLLLTECMCDQGTCVSHTGGIEHFYPLRSTSFCKWPFLLLLSSRRQILIKLHQEKSLFIYVYLFHSFSLEHLRRGLRERSGERGGREKRPPTSAKKKRGERLGKTSFPKLQIKEGEEGPFSNERGHGASRLLEGNIVVLLTLSAYSSCSAQGTVQNFVVITCPYL